MYSLTAQDQHAVAVGTVRRLTPTECVRLQAFPDDYLEGLGLSDSAKYRMLGNSMCTNVIRWLGERIALVESIISEKVGRCGD